MPAIVFGCWHLAPGSETVDAVREAVIAGYRGFDTAYSYGNDFYVARALKKTQVPRRQLFITNKVWNSFRGQEAVVECCKKSLRLMRQDYFDLYLVHWPVSIAQDGWVDINRSTWAGMEQLYREGLVRAIGLSNFSRHHIRALIKQGIETMPLVNQIEFHPGFYPKELLEYCQSLDMLVEGWSPLGSGEVLKHPLIIQLAQKYCCTPAQICLAWVAQKGVIPVPRTKTPDRMVENNNVFSVLIEQSDLMLIDQLEGIGWSGFDADENQPDS